MFGRIERVLFPDRIKKRLEKEAVLKRSIEINEAAQAYLNDVPQLLQSEIINVNEELGSTVQFYQATENKKLVLLVPGFGSTGQKQKYDWLISDLLRNGVDVVRTNNIPRFHLTRHEWEDGYEEEHQEKYREYISAHFKAVTNILAERNVLNRDVDLNIIASSAGATAALAMFDSFKVIPQSLVLLGPSGDINEQFTVPAIDRYLNQNGKIHLIRGQHDGFKHIEPNITLQKTSVIHPLVSVVEIPHTGHDLTGEGLLQYSVQVNLHHECLRGLNQTKNN